MSKTQARSALAGLGKVVLRRAQEHQCYLCGQPLPDRGSGSFDPATADHVHPWSAGEVGTYHDGNILLAHRSCNMEKSNRHPRACEVLYLFAINRRLGYDEDTTRKWDQKFIPRDSLRPPTPPAQWPKWYSDWYLAQKGAE